MLIDLHAHSSGISHCCRIPYDEVIRTAKEAGLCGIVLTNHYPKYYVTDGDYAAFIRRHTGMEYPTGPFVDEQGNVQDLAIGAIDEATLLSKIDTIR